MKDWMIYEKIQELKRNKLNKSQTSRQLGIDYKTVLKYWDMPPDGFAKALDKSKERTKKADKYKDIVISLSLPIIMRNLILFFGESYFCSIHRKL